MEKEIYTKHQCLNCEHPLQETDKFCPSCGQKRTDGKISFKILVGDLLENLFSIDSKLLRTCKILFFFPGRLTKAYFAGQHQQYYTPARLFLFFIAIHFLIFQLAFGVKNEYAIQAEAGKIYGIDSFYHTITPQISNKEDRLRVDSLYKEALNRQIFADIQHLGIFKFEMPSYNDSLSPQTLDALVKKNIRTAELLVADLDSLYIKRNVSVSAEKLAIKRVRKLLSSPQNFMNNFLGRISWVVFLIVPFAALLLKLLYIRRKRYYVEHWVFTLHLHSWLFAVLSIVYIIIWWNNSMYIWLVFLAGLLVYLLGAVRRYYQQGWLKTCIKSFLFLFLYLLIFILFTLGLGVFGFFFF